MTQSIQSPLSPQLAGRAPPSLGEINSLLRQRSNAQYVLDYADGLLSQENWDNKGGNTTDPAAERIKSTINELGKKITITKSRLPTDFGNGLSGCHHNTYEHRSL